MKNNLLRYFAFDHLPDDLRAISAPFHDMASALDDVLPDGSEKTVAIRKLLESKDAAVRSYAIDGGQHGESQK